MKFRPLHDRVVVKRIDAEAKSAAGAVGGAFRSLGDDNSRRCRIPNIVSAHGPSRLL
jgi:hypothetical protein